LADKVPIPPSGWLALNGGFLVALELFRCPETPWLAHFGVTLIHETGHWISGWLFGYPSFLYFDDQFTQGMTVHSPFNESILMGIYLIMGGSIGLPHHPLLTRLKWILVIVVYSLIVFSDLSKSVILSMGHGAELALAGGLLYLTVTNPRFWICLICATLGFYLIMVNLSLAHQLLYDDYYQVLYLYQGKHDLAQLAYRHFHGQLTPVATLLFWSCFLPLSTVIIKIMSVALGNKTKHR